MQIPVTTSGRTHPYHPNVRPRLSQGKPLPCEPALLKWRPVRYLSRFRTYQSPTPSRSRLGRVVWRGQSLSALQAKARSTIFLPFLIAITSFAQDPAILQNQGEPMRVGYACAEEDLQWAGMSCDENDPCLIYLELSAIASKGRKVLVGGDLHSTSATLASILLETDDSGSTWKEQAARIFPAGVNRGGAIDQVQFFDADHAWAAGETQYPLPRDPFVLMTTDGTATWRERALGEEGSAGSVLRLWFDSAEHGELIVDAGKTAGAGRYISYESDSGGDLWTLRGTTDKIPPLRRAPGGTDDADWRIRPGNDGKDYQLEKRVGDAWAPAASFLIDVATCKADPGKITEPKP
jgi:hypothetical protein